MTKIRSDLHYRTNFGRYLQNHTFKSEINDDVDNENIENIALISRKYSS
jgi:hypothetical protein